jgi:RNA polymerase sigma factor (sigma-70 family)
MVESEIIKGCIKNNRESQKALYEKMYGTMLGVCLRYSNNMIDAKEVLHEGFLNVFENLKNVKNPDEVESWIKKIMVNKSIEHIRKNKQNLLIVSTVHLNKNNVSVKDEITDEAIISKIGKEEIMKAVQELSQGYRTVYNLFVIDGYPHKEIADMLDISEDTSKLNLSKAKFALRKNLIQFLNTDNG